MSRKRKVKLAIIDNAVDHEIYRPVEHWSPHLNVPWETFEAKSGSLPDPEAGFSHFIITGSEASVLEREAWAEAETDLIRRIVRKGAAVLASCWGHQLLAYALLGRGAVRRCRQPEIGWIPVDIPASADVLGGPSQAYSFSLHYDEVAETGGLFDVLASSPLCPIQAMALKGGRCWGFQIHPEIDVESGRRLLKDSLGLNPRNDPLVRAALHSEPRDSGLVHRIVKIFLAS